jgi:hypothetical protein
MPVHDWTTVTAGIFHDFHQAWAIEIRRALNGGVLPPGYSAMAEQWAGGTIPNVLTLQSSKRIRPPHDNDGGEATLAPSATKVVHARTPAGALARRANRIAIRHRLGRVVAVIELVTPGNTESKREVRQFVEKTVDFLSQGVHVLLVDLFPPTSRDPDGLHSLIWDELAGGEPDEIPAEKPASLVSYQAATDERVAWRRRTSKHGGRAPRPCARPSRRASCRTMTGRTTKVC